MKIKNITLYGFKSFPDQSNLALNAGITAFVGPNGSGKSNIFDALRWVFGEQSMKALRCERIEDLIYISPDMLNDANFTEVSVTIDNEDYFPQFGGEFEIKRRFYRSGESEFFLNRVKCRLADIQALFLNSGTLTYSFLELSEIEKIIHGDTKQMFDDVSGILKYQERREQTKRRLEATEQDLLRLEDIIHEMQRSLRSLRRQVRQTRLYHELRDELNVLTLSILKQEYTQAEQEYGQKQAHINEKENQRQSIVQKVRQLQQQREELKTQMQRLESQKQDTLARVQEVVSAIGQVREAIAEQEKEAQHIILSNERIITSIKEKEETVAMNQQRLVEFEKNCKELKKLHEQKSALLHSDQAKIDVLSADLFQLRRALEEVRKKTAECATAMHAVNQEMTKQQYEQQNKTVLLERISEELASKRGDYEKNLRVRKEIDEELGLLVNQQDELTKELDREVQACTECEKSLGDLEKDIVKRQEIMAECKAVIDALRGRLREKGSVKEVRDVFGSRCKGLLRDSMDVTSGYESVVDICLGDLLNYYMIQHNEKEDFTSLPDGRFGFILRDGSGIAEAATVSPEGTTSLTDYITLHASAKHCAPYLAGYYIVGTSDQALTLSRQYPGSGFATLDGLLARNGTVIVEKGEIGYFKISQSLDEHTARLETLKNEMVFTSGERDRLTGDLDTARRRIEQLREKLFSTNVKKSECSLKENQLARMIDKIQEEFDGLETDKGTFSNELLHIEEHLKVLSQTYDEHNAKHGEYEIENHRLLEEGKALEEKIAQQNADCGQQKLEVVALEERLNSTHASIDALQHHNDVIVAEVNALKQENAAQALEQVESKIAELRGQLGTKEAEKSAIEQELPEQASKELSQRINDIFDQLDIIQKDQESLQNEIMQLKYESFQLSHKRDENYNKAREEFKVDLRDYTIDEDIVDPSSRLCEVRGKLEKLGEVNPLSLDLYEKEKKRLDEFLAQRDDIIAARKNLLGSIDELDTRARDRFVTTFSQVKEQFNFVFSNFFEGGHADLVLSDESSPLTSKVDIVVRMKGKRVKKINQLSGGERTLLAISLLLAFYLVKPAPFCILDEIDAPLDDANVVRFNKFLRDLSQRTQVIIITHNRATMEYADYLYGLTMEKPGQSKIISARLADLEQIDAHVQ
ncbi:chromosome segregation protein SMC [candidate division WOR-3 bacterium]|nr:chromosome segregation protein SMC [candidate division WOR-3 bacterium]